MPDALRCRGSGGGSPEGRRRLRTRWIAGGAGRGAGIGRAPMQRAPAAAMPCRLMFPPSRARGPSPFGPSRRLPSIHSHPSPGGVRRATVDSRASLCALLLLVVTACSGSAEPVATDSAPTIRFASFDFQENQILVELYAEGARRRGLPVSVQQGVGTREVVSPALQQGVVDVVIDYLGTALTFAQPSAPDLPREPAEMHALLARTLADRDVVVLDVAEAEDQNGFAVTTAFAARERRRQAVGAGRPRAVARRSAGHPSARTGRSACWGFEDVYGLEFGEVLTMPSRAATVEALHVGADRRRPAGDHRRPAGGGPDRAADRRQAGCSRRRTSSRWSGRRCSTVGATSCGRRWTRSAPG